MAFVILCALDALHVAVVSFYLNNTSMRTSQLTPTILLTTMMALLLITACGRKSIRNQVLAEMNSSDAIEVSAPNNANLVFENEFIKAVSVELGPGELLPEHPGADRLVYALTDCKLSLSGKSGNSSLNWAAGDATWMSAGVHQVENAGDKPARYLIVNRVTSGLPGLRESKFTNDLLSTTPEFSERIIENEVIQVAKVRLPAGTKTPVFMGMNSLLYSLNLATLKRGKVVEGNEKALFEELSLNPGEAYWQDRGNQIFENPGEVDANYLVVSFKQ